MKSKPMKDKDKPLKHGMGGMCRTARRIEARLKDEKGYVGGFEEMERVERVRIAATQPRGKVPKNTGF